MADAISSGQLERDCGAVVRFPGPKAIGMPELHKLTPFLGNLQDKGYKVALVTDGRMSGASGKGARRHSFNARGASRWFDCESTDWGFGAC